MIPTCTAANELSHIQGHWFNNAPFLFYFKLFRQDRVEIPLNQPLSIFFFFFIPQGKAMLLKTWGGLFYSIDIKKKIYDHPVDYTCFPFSIWPDKKEHTYRNAMILQILKVKKTKFKNASIYLMNYKIMSLIYNIRFLCYLWCNRSFLLCFFFFF